MFIGPAAFGWLGSTLIPQKRMPTPDTLVTIKVTLSYTVTRKWDKPSNKDDFEYSKMLEQQEIERADANLALNPLIGHPIIQAECL